MAWDAFVQWWEGSFPGWRHLPLALTLILLSILAGLLFYRVAFSVLRRMANRTDNRWDDIFVRHLQGPLRLLAPLLALLLVVPSLHLPAGVIEIIHQLLSLGFIAGMAWVVISGIYVLRDLVLDRFSLHEKDNLKARAIYTQVNGLLKVALFVTVVITVASMLMTFESVRQIGVSLLASAGIAGIIIGFAAQKSLSTLFAGIQLAITQPIRIDDVVIIEGEWGQIEEITLTYVVVRIWDLRRLVVPISNFIEKPFQNWTRVTANLLGTVYLYADYSVPVEEVRAQLHRFLQESEHWDGQVWGLQITDSTERTMELRALMSAQDASRAWNLRCEIREKLLTWLQQNYAGSLPRLRTELHSAASSLEKS